MSAVATFQVRVYRPDGRVRDLITTHDIDDAKRVRAAFAGSVPRGFRVEIESPDQHDVPEGLRPFDDERKAA